jgi:uncharacterized repeat protein (TIGR02543 family)
VWSLRDAEDTATKIDQTGKLSVAEGETAKQITVTATASNKDFAQATVNIFANENDSGITISPPTARVFTGNSAQFDISVTGGVSLTLEGQKSSQTTLTTDGLLTVGVDESAKTILVRATKNGGASVTAKVTVQKIIEVQVFPIEMTIEKGGNQRFSARVAGDNLDPAQRTVSWSAAAVAGGTLDAETKADVYGAITIGKSETSTKLYLVATSKMLTDKKGSSEITVVEAPVITGISITPDNASVYRGGQQQFTAEVKTEGGASQNVKWSIVETGLKSGTKITADTGVLSVDPGETKLSLTIKAASAFDSGKSASVNVTIQAVTDVAVTPTVANILKGDTFDFTELVTQQGGADTRVIWSIDENKDAGTFVNNSGFVTISENETLTTLTLRATSMFDGEISGTAKIFVASVTGVTITPSTLTINANTGQTFTVNVTGVNLTQAQKTVSWKLEGKSANSTTTLSDTGYLSVGQNETSTTLLVRATHVKSMSATATASVENKVAITFNANGGYSPVTSSQVSYGSKVAVLPTPTKEGYSFEGWFDTSSPTGGNQFTTSITVTAPKTVYARWKIGTYTATFNPQGGSVSPTSTTATYGSNVSLPTPSKEGYAFDSWWTETSGGSKYTSLTMPENGIALYAHWVIKTYTVTWNANSGSVNPGSSTVNHGATITPPTPAKSGYTFTGWFDTAAANGGSQFFATTTVTAAKTLWARWVVTAYTVTWDANGGTVTPATNSGTAGSTVSMPTPAKSGYTFNGWYSATSGGTKYNSLTMPANDLTLYAQWTVIPTYTITFDKNGSDATAPHPATMTVTQNTSVGTLPTQTTRKFHTFKGWFDTTSKTGGTEFKANTNVNANKTVYARWEAYWWTLTFDTNGGDTTIAAKQTDYGTSVTFPGNPPKTGNTFLGWFDAATGGTKVTALTMPANDVTLYAQWATAVHTITFNPNGGTVTTTAVVANYGTTVSTLPVPAKAGNTFSGWFDTAQETGGVGFTTSTQVTGNKTVYARWTPITYTITFNAAGGSPTPATVTVAEGGTFSNLATITKSNDDIFQGWFTAQSGGTKWTAQIVVTENITLYAQWKALYEWGATGPGGGLVYYDKGSYSNGWRYLEMAPKNKEVQKKYHDAVAYCNDFVNNGKDDWFLPAYIHQVFTSTGYWYLDYDITGGWVLHPAFQWRWGEKYWVVDAWFYSYDNGQNGGGGGILAGNNGGVNQFCWVRPVRRF